MNASPAKEPACGPLTAKERQALKARAHKLEPIVTIGGKGLTGAVLREIELALKAHALVKIRAAAMERDERRAAFEAICERTGAHPVQHVGKVLVVYRRGDEEA